MRWGFPHAPDAVGTLGLHHLPLRKDRMVNTIKLFFGGSPDDVTAQYKEWLAQHPDIEIIEKPTIVQEQAGWKLTSGTSRAASLATIVRGA